MAVVAAFEFDDLLAPGGTACEADRAHACFGARTHQTHHVDAGNQRDDGFGEFDFALCGRAKRETVKHRFLHRLHHGRVAMPQDHRAPGSDVVDVALPVGVPEIGAFCTLNKTRCSTHCAERADRRIHAARDQCFGAFEELQVSVR